MADEVTKASQESNYEFVNVENLTPENSSPEMIDGEEAEEEVPVDQGDREQDLVDLVCEKPLLPKPTATEPLLASTAGVDELVKKKFAQPSPTAMEVPHADGYLSFLNVLHPLVLYIIYWNDLKLSVVALTTTLVVLATLCINTMLHTTILLLLAGTVVSLLYIVIKIAIDSFYNRDIRNPFQAYFDRNEGIPHEKVIRFVRYALLRANCYYKGLVRLVFFANTVSSLKFMIALFFLSYVTNCLDFITAVTFGVTFLFTAPPLYRRYQPQVDGVIEKIATTLRTVYCTIYSKVPFLPKSKED